MAFSGQRFEFHLSDDEDDDDPGSVEAPRPSSHDLVVDIRERNPPTASAPKPPTLTSASPSSSGFPAHKIRSRPSTFRQQRIAPEATSTTRRSLSDEEKWLIDEENRQRLAAMSPAQIERERAELVKGLSPSLIERLLRRATIDSEPPKARREVNQMAMEATQQPIILEKSSGQLLEGTLSTTVNTADDRTPCPISICHPPPSSQTSRTITSRTLPMTLPHCPGFSRHPGIPRTLMLPRRPTIRPAL
jgi:RPAP1-like, N-terminal